MVKYEDIVEIFKRDQTYETNIKSGIFFDSQIVDMTIAGDIHAS